MTRTPLHPGEPRIFRVFRPQVFLVVVSTIIDVSNTVPSPGYGQTESTKVAAPAPIQVASIFFISLHHNLRSLSTP